MQPRTRQSAVTVLCVALFCLGPMSDRVRASGPLVKWFAGWVDRADRHRADWERASAELTPQRRSEATRLADRLFGGMWGGYWTSLTGYERAGANDFLAKAAVERAPAEIVEPARSYLLWRLSSVRAEEARRSVGAAGAADPVFWDAYAGHVLHGRHFGFLRERAAHVIPRMIAEASLGTALHEEGVPSAAAAYALLTSARWELERALERFGQGYADQGILLVTNAVVSLRRARSHGISPGRVEAMLGEHFGDRLASNEPVTFYRGQAMTFRDALHDGIAYRTSRADRKPGVDLQPLALLFLDEKIREPVTRASRLEEHVVVTADAVNLNLAGYLLRELNVVVDDAAGRPVLRRYTDLEILGRLLFVALLAETANDKVYARIRSSCASWLLERHGIRTSGATLTRTMIGMGRRVLNVPGVVQGLGRSRRGARLLGRLALLDSPALHAHVGNLWIRRAMSLRETEDPSSELARLVDRMSALRSAQRAYGKASLRFEPDGAPPVLRSLARAAERDARADRERALALADERGLDDTHSIAEFMGGTVGAKARAEMLREFLPERGPADSRSSTP